MSSDETSQQRRGEKTQESNPDGRVYPRENLIALATSSRAKRAAQDAGQTDIQMFVKLFKPHRVQPRSLPESVLLDTDDLALLKQLYDEEANILTNFNYYFSYIAFIAPTKYVPSEPSGRQEHKQAAQGVQLSRADVFVIRKGLEKTIRNNVDHLAKAAGLIKDAAAGSEERFPSQTQTRVYDSLKSDINASAEELFSLAAELSIPKGLFYSFRQRRLELSENTSQARRL